MIHLFHELSKQCSKEATKRYSTSFASSIKLLHKDMQQHIHNIYGFVRFADEIVDSFHDYDKASLLHEFKAETYKAIERCISLNPILNSFQMTVNHYEIDRRLIDAFLYSMQLDLEKKIYERSEYEEYIYGSAEVVGLMCLYIFCEGNKVLYNKLKPFARSLGAAFQKVNFLRDIQNDFHGLNRMYFPDCDFNNFKICDKLAIEKDIQQDFDNAYKGILQLPVKAKLGVYVAYCYYASLFNKIKKLKPQNILHRRIRIPDYSKALIVAEAGIRNRFNLM